MVSADPARASRSDRPARTSPNAFVEFNDAVHEMGRSNPHGTELATASEPLSMAPYQRYAPANSIRHE